MIPYQLHLVRVGAMGQVGRFAPVDAARYERGRRVIVRTPRGLEVGEVLTPPPLTNEKAWSDGPLLRAMTNEDEMLEARLQMRRNDAFEVCSARVAELGIGVQLLDVEHLFDGKNLVFYFLGDQPPELTSLVEELTEQYDTTVEFRQFADALTTGCGPGCGTSEATGGGCGSCGTGCAVSGSCGTKH